MIPLPTLVIAKGLAGALAGALAIALLASSAGQAFAQFPMPGAGSPMSGSGGMTQPFPSPMQPPQQQRQQPPPQCVELMALRDDAGKKAQAIGEANKRKATPVQTCPLFNAFAAAELKLVKSAETLAGVCGIPPQTLATMKESQKRTQDIRGKVCQAAANPPRPAGPSLSDALGASRVPDASNVKPGRGTFDTLTGTPLGAAR